jgi:CHAD domain-containing protein
MADGKWIPGLTSDTPVVEAARKVLSVRLDVVRNYLPLAAWHSEDDVEYVHHLRVATRRTGAALKLFRDCLPEKRAKEAKKRLKRIRRAAGEARDWDVFVKNLAQWATKRPAGERRGLDFLEGVAYERRAGVQPGLVESAEERFDPNTVLAALGEPDDFNAPRQLGRLAEIDVNDLLGQLDKEIARESNDYAHLHRVRILGKRVRYAMEVFADCFAPAFREDLYPAVEQMQEILGEANDSHVAAERLGELRDSLRATRAADWKRYGSGIDHVLKHHQTRLPAQRKQFAAWQKKWRALRADVPHWTPVLREVAEVTETK